MRQHRDCNRRTKSFVSATGGERDSSTPLSQTAENKHENAFQPLLERVPDLRSQRFVTLAELIDDALWHVVNHKDRRNYESKALIVKKALGGKKAEDLKPKEIAAWLNSHCNTPATYNRYKAFLSLCYCLGEENDKVQGNPARKAPHRREPSGRIRFLNREDEYPRLHAAITKLFPEHVAEFVVSVHTGIRLSEQYTVEWSQYRADPHDPNRRVIELSKTKNGDDRTVHLNTDAHAAIESMRIPGQRMKDACSRASAASSW